MTGREGGRFAPQANVTRAETAVILRAFQNLDAPEIPETPAEDTNVLVVYFSATGNTEEVAGYIAEAAGGDLFELTPADPYTSEDLNWTDENSRVVYEYENPEARDVALAADTVENWDDYDVVFLGYPIWWGIAAWPVNGFVEANDFTGKTVIPFCTSSSSGVGESGQLLAGLAGCCCDSMDDVEGANMKVVLAVMAGYLVSCIAGTMSGTGISLFVSLFPLVSIFCAPVQFALGNIGLGILILSWLLQVLVIAGMAVFSARVYNDLIIYRGSRVGFGKLLAMAGKKGGRKE